jgi:N-acetyl-anhydromuramyl-L-alanine amidase AmpD
MAYTPQEIELAIIQEGLTARTSGPSELLHPVITPRGIQIALATAIVETNDQDLANPDDPASEALPNDGDGTDHTSEGVFQQQEQWWGTVTERMNPADAAAMFYSHLAGMNYNDPNTSPGTFAQDVQQSAYPDRYDQEFPAAVAQYTQLIGQVGQTPPAAPTSAPPPFTETDMTQNNGNDEDREGYAVKWFILHTEEGGMTGAPFEEWMASNEVSYHYIVNPDGSVIDMETTDVASWSVLDPANEESINLCFAGSTIYWTRQEWLSNMQIGIKSAAYIAVRDCTKYGIDIQVLVGPDYPRVVTETGITDHYAITVNQLAPGSTHVDVGPNFPWDVFWNYVQQFQSNTEGDGDLTSDEHNALMAIAAALTAPVASLSIYRDPNVNGQVPSTDLWTRAQLISNDDGMVHELYVEHSALLGDPDSLHRVALVAAGDGAVTDAVSIARAKQVLESVSPAILKAYEVSEEASA